ncbi:MAG: hypothetical protein RMJ35_11075, partial [Phycisphaerales bacterium]|nr:hypothetical protein [Phycisphaerales bacterium]
MKSAWPVLLACFLTPAVALAGDRWSDGGGRDRGYRYDRGERYHHSSSSRASYGFSFGFGSSSCDDFGFVGFRYSRGFTYPRRYIYDYDYSCYRPPIVIRETYCPPPVVIRERYIPPAVVYSPAPRVYYPDPCGSTTYYSGGTYYGGSVYYYK